MPTAMLNPARCTLALLALAHFGVSASARPQAELGPTRADQELLDHRDREFLHRGGEPLKLTPIEESGFDLRAGTPALTRVKRATLMVDGEENHRRRLAAYVDGTVSSAPLPVVLDAEATGSTPGRTGTRSTSDGAEAARRWPWLALASVLLLGLFGLSAARR